MKKVLKKMLLLVKTCTSHIYFLSKGEYFKNNYFMIIILLWDPHVSMGSVY